MTFPPESGERARKFPLEIQGQPDDFTCGPTCLQAIYRHFGDDVPVSQLAGEVASPGGFSASLARIRLGIASGSAELCRCLSKGKFFDA